MPKSKLVMKDVNRSDVPITFEFQMSIRGGRLKQATVIPLDVVLHGGSECRFTLVSHRTPWLCEMVSGVRQWSSPLKGASMVRRLKKLMADHSSLVETAVLEIAPVTDDKMAGFLDSDDEQPAAKPQARSKKFKEDVATQKVIEVTVPESATAEKAGTGETRKLLLLRRNDLQVRIHLDALPWLVQQLQTEIQDGSDEPSPEQTVSSRTPYWDFAKDAWCGRVKCPAGTIVRRMQSVKDRMKSGNDLCDISFAAAKQRVYEEVAAWTEEVEKNGQPPELQRPRGRPRNTGMSSTLD